MILSLTCSESPASVPVRFSMTCERYQRLPSSSSPSFSAISSSRSFSTLSSLMNDDCEMATHIEHLLCTILYPPLDSQATHDALELQNVRLWLE